MRTSKRKPEQELETIKNVLKKFPEGAAIEELKASLGFGLELRTLQRRLEKLREQGFITTSGGTRSTRYHLVGEVTSNTLDTPRTTPLLPLTEQSEDILSAVSAPLQKRIPVGYNRAFPENYRPNIDGYLSVSERKKLFEIGKTGLPDQPAGTYAKEILNRLLIDLSWNSSRLEGNTYSLLDTERLIAVGEPADNKSATEAQMILNHKEAIEFIVKSADEIGFNRYTVLNLHALLSNNLLPDPAAPGRLRRFGVGISNSVYTPLSIPQLIEEMFELVLEKAGAINNPFEQAFFIMVHLPYLQPFEDVNKRVSRLAANIPLNRHNLIPLSFIDVPRDLYISGLLGVYELNRIELLKDVFLWAYERSAARYGALRQSVGEPDLFRLRYRQPMREVITNILSNSMNQRQASETIKAKALTLPNKDRAKFIEHVETELMALHEGNFARYMITPSEFLRWNEAWKK